jgi:hypothetical protein
MIYKTSIFCWGLKNYCIRGMCTLWKGGDVKLVIERVESVVYNLALFGQEKKILEFT